MLQISRILRCSLALPSSRSPAVGLRPEQRHPCVFGWSSASVVVLLVAVLLLPANCATSAGQSLSEYQVKAAYLFNFLKFVEWPDDPGGDQHAKFVIGFVGGTLINSELSRLVEGKTVLGRDLQVRTFQASDNLRACNILFISTSEKKRLPAILASLRGSTVMTVADMSDFIDSGGMVQFGKEDGRLRVTIDMGATARAHLRVSSKLLALARAVTAAEGSLNN